MVALVLAMVIVKALVGIRHFPCESAAVGRIKGAGAPFQLNIQQIYCANNFCCVFSRHFLLSTLILLYLD